MSRPRMTNRFAMLASLAVLLVGLGCSVDTPTAPDQVPAPPPTVGDNNWSISVSVDPDVLEVGVTGDDGTGVVVPAIVSVDVKSRFDGTSPPPGTSMIVSTTLGELGTEGSGATSVGIILTNGRGQVFLFPGNIAATGTVTARLEGSQATDRFEVVGAIAPFITAVVPNSGSESGGTRVTVQGTGFGEPLVVRFGTFPATVLSVTDTAIQVITPPASGPLDSDSCGTGGTEYFATAFPVSVELASGQDGTLANAFFYTPDNTGCIGGS